MLLLLYVVKIIHVVVTLSVDGYNVEHQAVDVTCTNFFSPEDLTYFLTGSSASKNRSQWAV